MLVIALTAFVACALPLRYWLAWADPDAGPLIGLPVLQTLPRITVIIALVVICVESILMIAVVVRMWNIIDSFTRGVFFSPTVVSWVRSVGHSLLLVAALHTAGMMLGLISSGALAQSSLRGTLWIQVFNLPSSTVLCGTIALITASVLEKSCKMAREAKFTV